MKTEGPEKVWKVEEKCRTVLAIWTERMKAVEVRKEMGISGSLLIQWQDRAMEGMLEALEPQRMREVTAGPALGKTVRKLLDRKARLRETGVMSKLEKKVMKLHEEKNGTPA
jgi:hypothetical protein